MISFSTLRRYRPYFTFYANKYYRYGDKTAIPYTVDAIIRHPKYNSWLIDNDVCLLYTKKRIIFNDDVTPACLPSDRVNVGTKCFVAGWGRTGQYSAYAHKLQELDVDIIGMFTENFLRNIN